MTPAEVIILSLFFFIIATLYSSAGFGGGSSYLTLLAMTPLDYFLIRSSALVCNLTVVASNSLIFYKAGSFSLIRSLPFILGSVPMAFVGGRWLLSQKDFFIFLGITLLVASIGLWFFNGTDLFLQKNQGMLKRFLASFIGGIVLGAGIGFLSGLVGIGGGIFLSPLLFFISWGKAKEISSLASLFILVNSVSGLVGLYSKNVFQLEWGLILPLAVSVFTGSQIGSRLNVKVFSTKMIRRVTSILIFIISLRILLKYAFQISIF